MTPDPATIEADPDAELVEAMARAMCDQIGVTMPADIRLVWSGEGRQERVVNAARAAFALTERGWQVSESPIIRQVARAIRAELEAQCGCLIQWKAADALARAAIKAIGQT